VGEVDGMSSRDRAARRKRRAAKERWRRKRWYMVISPPYLGGEKELNLVPADSPEKLIGRVMEATLYDITDDFSHQVIKLYFQITEVEDRRAKTIFRGHEYSRDFLRSLIRRRTTKVTGIFDVTTKDGYTLRVTAVAFTVTRIKTSQEKAIRAIMREILQEKSKALNFDQFVQEMILGKIASDIYNKAKSISPLRHVGIMKSKLLAKPVLEAMAVASSGGGSGESSE